jgi:hypothetical protein
MRPLDLPGIQNSSRARVFAFGCAWLISGCCGSGSSNDPSAQADAAPGPSSTSAPATSTGSTDQFGPRADLAQQPDGVPVRPAPVEREIAGAMHILIAYKGAENAPKTITRTKEDARKRAETALNELKKDESKFAELVKKYSDDAISKPADGRLGNFERNAMPATFSDACFSMKVDALSDVVESPRGFHIIKRTK